mmetsp:Transcript_33726/g.48949  ORF Transcript_33726/g.48949 Transcript_33726/m.48949 type:complete len:174 (+) Transcript_33726:34-555(+)
MEASEQLILQKPISDNDLEKEKIGLEKLKIELEKVQENSRMQIRLSDNEKQIRLSDNEVANNNIALEREKIALEREKVAVEKVEKENIIRLSNRELKNEQDHSFGDVAFHWIIRHFLRCLKSSSSLSLSSKYSTGGLQEASPCSQTHLPGFTSRIILTESRSQFPRYRRKLLQ